LRHAAGAALAEAGCSDKQIASILGHRSQSMTAHYTRQARQRTLASEAMQKLVDRQRRTGTERESGKTSDASGKSSLKK
ncbi:MAG: tyrosine-type recombinase/integrase, partial [Hyphomicrobiaceae bacterium]|nr:tyrosine-type recombinase/integrase [Hyphomicrobiaceae bacterium]